MAHEIQDNDNGVIGFCNLFGNPWHGLPQYIAIDGEVPMEMAERAFAYTVEKSPIHVCHNGEFIKQDGIYALTRDGKALCPTVVTDEYCVVDNDVLLKLADKFRKAHNGVKLEGVGTLAGGHRLFVNLMLNADPIGGDPSPTVDRLMFTNAHGLESFAGCMHSTRIVCMNTLRMAMAQGAANDTVKRIRHTSGIADAIEDYAVSILAIMDAANKHREALAALCHRDMTESRLTALYDGLLVGKGGTIAGMQDGKAKSRAQNVARDLRAIFDGGTITVGKGKEAKEIAVGADLQDIAIRGTAYAAFQSVTDYADHWKQRKGDQDAGSLMWDNLFGGGDALKQKAFDLLTREDSPVLAA